jgi:signal transduction histidine kinase
VAVLKEYTARPIVKANTQEMLQVFVNLITNAIQAMDGKGTLGLAVGNQNGTATVKISDTGPGIAEDLQDKIFEPFFTTKEPGKGTGLGLRVVRTLVGLSNPVNGLEIQKNYKVLPRCKVKPEEIIQVFVHIIKNGIQAMKGKGTLSLNTDVSYGSISVRIRDTGPGIPANFSPRIFEPFFTTKGPGQGTGLGLTIARRIVMRYGGVIRVKTEEGQGTIFILFFPASAAVTST